ncbi:chitin synthase [Ceratobasidium sp. AG-Ba]|nr:chitin synthase [Ceratobasidium sp. AG-Ba]
MYRIRTADKGRPIIISSRIIDDYNEGIVDTLHKKNLLSVGEDRYLTTLMMKHFPKFKLKFTPNAIAHTIAPDQWSVLMSQRRWWINPTVHNLFIVFLDLVGTIILLATDVFLVYLIVITATGKGPLPIISLAMIAATYGLQAIIFLLKREYPVYSFFLPIYSFWCMDDFSWGNTRMTQGDGKGGKVVVVPEDDHFDDSMIPLKKFGGGRTLIGYNREYQEEAWETGSHKSEESKRTGFTQAAKSMSAHDFARYRNGDGAGSMYGHSLRSQGSHRNLQNQYLTPQFSGISMAVDGRSVHMGTMGMNPYMMGSMSSMGMMNNPYAASTTGGAPRNSMMTNLNMFEGSADAHATGNSGLGAELGAGGGRPLSTFSMATTAGPLASGLSQSTQPRDEGLLAVLGHHLASQDPFTMTEN